MFREVPHTRYSAPQSEKTRGIAPAGFLLSPSALRGGAYRKSEGFKSGYNLTLTPRKPPVRGLTLQKAVRPKRLTHFTT